MRVFILPVSPIGIGPCRTLQLEYARCSDEQDRQCDVTNRAELQNKIIVGCGDDLTCDNRT